MYALYVCCVFCVTENEAHTKVAVSSSPGRSVANGPSHLSWGKPTRSGFHYWEWWPQSCLLGRHLNLSKSPKALAYLYDVWFLNLFMKIIPNRLSSKAPGAWASTNRYICYTTSLLLQSLLPYSVGKKTRAKSRPFHTGQSLWILVPAAKETVYRLKEPSCEFHAAFCQGQLP